MRIQLFHCTPKPHLKKVTKPTTTDSTKNAIIPSELHILPLSLRELAALDFVGGLVLVGAEVSVIDEQTPLSGIDPARRRQIQRLLAGTLHARRRHLVLGRRREVPDSGHARRRVQVLEGGRGHHRVPRTPLAHPLAQPVDHLPVLDIDVALSRHAVVGLWTHGVIFNRQLITLSPLFSQRKLVFLMEGLVIHLVVLARGIVFYFACLEAFLVFLIPQLLANSKPIIQLLAPYLLHLLHYSFFLL